MPTETFTFDGKRMDDGRIYITSNDLTGFRLIVHPGENVEAELVSALNAFFPLYMAVKAKAAAKARAPKIATHQVRDHNSYSFSAEYAMA
jgi:hypothetical protein